MEKDFTFQWERLINGFDSTEELGLWNKEEYGEMEVYCENVLITVLMHFMAVDNTITQAEVDAINSMFGFEFTLDNIMNICETMEEELENYVEAPKQMINVIEDANPKIAEAFKTLLIDACSSILESDSMTSEEKSELQEMIDLLN